MGPEPQPSTGRNVFTADFVGVRFREDFAGQATTALSIVGLLMMHAGSAGPKGFESIGTLQTKQEMFDRLRHLPLVLFWQFIDCRFQDIWRNGLIQH